MGRICRKMKKIGGESNFSSGNGQPREPTLYVPSVVSAHFRDRCAAISYRPEVRSPCDSWERIASSRASRCAPERNRTEKNKTDRWWIGRSAASAHISASRTRVTPRNASRTGRPTPPRGRVGNRSLEYEYAELQYATVGRRRVCAAAAAELPSVTAARRLPYRPSWCAGGGLNPTWTPIHHSLTRGRIY